MTQTPSRAEVFAPAKLNLFLEVTGRRSDGLHELNSLFVFLDIGDRLTFAEVNAEDGDDDLLMTPDLGVPRAKNLAWQALMGVKQIDPSLPTVSVSIEKRLPAEAGIGGGTANAAAVVHWAEGRTEQQVDFRSPLSGLGADMPPAMDQNNRLWGGTGNEPGRLVSGLSGLQAVLLKPPTGVSTGACFQALSGSFSPLHTLDESKPIIEVLQDRRNDLEGPARLLNPDIGTALKSLGALDGAELVRMTGSGSTCFALFKEKGQREAALDILGRRHPTWWLQGAEIL